MSSKPSLSQVGCPEMWMPVYETYRPLFDIAARATIAFNQIRKQCTTTEGLPRLVHRMICAVADTNGAVQILVLNGYGHDAMKLTRSLYETELNILWLKEHPEDIRDFVDYQIILRKHAHDTFDEEQRQRLRPGLAEEILSEYKNVLPRFATGRTKDRPRNEWCRVSLHERAKQAGMLELHHTFYRAVSSVHHGDIGGLLLQFDADGRMDVAPSWRALDSALASGVASFVRCLVYFDEIATLGFKEDLERMTSDYIAALNTIKEPPLLSVTETF